MRHAWFALLPLLMPVAPAAALGLVLGGILEVPIEGTHDDVVRAIEAIGYARVRVYRIPLRATGGTSLMIRFTPKDHAAVRDEAVSILTASVQPIDGTGTRFVLFHATPNPAAAEDEAMFEHAFWRDLRGDWRYVGSDPSRWFTQGVERLQADPQATTPAELSLLKVTLAQIRVAEGRDDDAVAMFEEAFHAVAGSDEPQAVSVAVLAAMNIGRMLSRRQRESTRRLGAEWLQRGNELYLGMVGQAAIDRELAPTLRANPEYPPQAGRRGIEGWVQVEFTVNEAGGVEDLRVVDSEPPQVFDEAALEATRRWKYRPRVLLGAPVRTPGIRVVHRFDVGSPPRRLPPTRHAGDVQADSGQQAAIDGEIVALARANPRYPQEAMLRATEGWVVVEFTVNEAGAVEDARVVDSEPPQVFDEAALDAIRTWKYRPRIEGGVPVPRRGTQVTIRFERGTPPRRPPPTPGTAAW